MVYQMEAKRRVVSRMLVRRAEFSDLLAGARVCYLKRLWMVRGDGSHTHPGGWGGVPETDATSIS